MITSEYTPVFQSAFSDKLRSFLLYKRSIGYKYESEAHQLSRLDQYFAAENINELTGDILEIWNSKRECESAKTHQLRTCVLKQFTLYLNRFDIKVSLLPKIKTRCFSKSFTPYIFTREQMYKIFVTADSISPKVNNDRIRLVIPVLLRLLYGCGLRVTEATALRIGNIDFERGSITILDGKNDDCRKVPVSKSLQKVLSDYLEKIYAAPSDNDFLFPTRKKEQYSDKTIYQTFREILWQSGIPHGGRGKGPRLHDLRHTFAVHSLQKLILEGKDTYLLLPILSTYLGHKNIYATENYLRLTSEMYPDILEKVYSACGRLVPEVTDYEAD